MVHHTRYADDATCVGKLVQLASSGMTYDISTLGPDYGYNVIATKMRLVVREKHYSSGCHHITYYIILS